MNKVAVKKLKGPILIIGAGGFIGFNFLKKFLEIRTDVYGMVHSKTSWRLRDLDKKSKLIVCDITSRDQTEKAFKKLKPSTIINCSAYGAYSHQEDTDKIYNVNFLSTVSILEILAKQKFAAYLHCGSSSEYGFNCSRPKESDELMPNSHYAVSKAAVADLISYYGKKEKMPVVHFRLYSVYGPWEEPNRLMPKIVENGLNKKLPKLVDGKISRDFVYIDDVIDAFIRVAGSIRTKHYGEVYNLGTGVKITIEKLAKIAKYMYDVKEPVRFGTMKKRRWDLSDWYGNVNKIKKDFDWKYKVSVKKGLEMTTDWQRERIK